MYNELKVKNPKTHAFVITLFNGDKYMDGVLCLLSALKRFGDMENSDVIILCGKQYGNSIKKISSKAKKLFRLFDAKIISVDILEYLKPLADTIIYSRKKWFYKYVWTKFHALRLTQYKKVCLLDADFLPNKSLNHIFNKYDTPAGVTEVPRILSSSEEMPEWYDMFNECCSTNKKINGGIILLLMFCRSEYADIKYGGINASFMMLEPNIDEFNNIAEDLKEYNSVKKIRFTYPEQEYITLRYAFGKNMNRESIIKPVLDFIKNDLDDWCIKITNVFEKKINNKCLSITNNEKKEIIVKKMYDIYDEYTNNYPKSDFGPWTSLGLEYQISEFQKKLPPQKDWIGFPMLQKKKIWEKEGTNIDILSIGCFEWFEESIRMIDYLVNVKKIDITKKKYKNLIKRTRNNLIRFLKSVRSGTVEDGRKEYFFNSNHKIKDISKGLNDIIVSIYNHIK